MAQKVKTFRAGEEHVAAALLKKRLCHQRSLLKYGMAYKMIFFIALTPVVTTVICILIVFLLVIAIVGKSFTLIVLSQLSMN